MWGRVLCIFYFLLLLPAAVQAATYYVDASAGNDGNNGTTIQTPWRSIAKVSGSTFYPGDSILFKSGNIWREQLTVPSSGSAGSPITFGSYGTGAKPVLSGANVVPSFSWKLYSGKIYVANVGSISPPTQLYVDGTYYDPAHYPNSGYLLATANSTDTTSIIDSNLNLSASQIVGATVRVKAVSWSISTSTATAFDPVAHKISLNGHVYNSTITMTPGWGFYLQNMLWMLNSPGAWYYDPVAGKLYLWTAGGDSPSGHIVEVSNRPYVVYDKAKNYVTIQNLATGKASQNDVYILNANNVAVNTLDVSGGQNGIYLDGSTSNSSVEYCSVQDPLSNGIVTNWWSVSDIGILKNTVTNAGNVGASPNASQAGIFVAGSSINIANNTVTGSGYIGIECEGDLIEIQNNIVDKSCLVLDDCGGIYTFGRNAGTTRKTISGNTVTNSIGNFSGTPNTGSTARGIYLDDFTYNTAVQNNAVSNADYGIHIHSGHNNAIQGNSFLNERRNGLWIQEDEGTPGCTHDNTVAGNTFETNSTDATALYNSSIETATNFGSFDHNRFCHPNSAYAVTNQNNSYTLPQWQQASGQDLNSTDTRVGCTPPSNLRLLGQ